MIRKIAFEPKCRKKFRENWVAFYALGFDVVAAHYMARWGYPS